MVLFLAIVCLLTVVVIYHNFYYGNDFYLATCLLLTIAYHRIELSFTYGEEKNGFLSFDNEKFIQKMQDRIYKG